jgi:hypothetical protein
MDQQEVQVIERTATDLLQVICTMKAADWVRALTAFAAGFIATAPPSTWTQLGLAGVEAAAINGLVAAGSYLVGLRQLAPKSTIKAAGQPPVGGA